MDIISNLFIAENPNWNLGHFYFLKIKETNYNYWFLWFYYDFNAFSLKENRCFSLNENINDIAVAYPRHENSISYRKPTDKELRTFIKELKRNNLMYKLFHVYEHSKNNIAI